MIGFSGELSVKHKAVSRTILVQELKLPSSRVRGFLNLDPAAEVVQVDRVMSVDGVPRMIVSISIVHSAGAS